jgi:nucleoside-diphosphate-sugar epimerase
VRVLVTGGGGFLGQHIVKKLLGRGYTVTSLSRGHYPILEEWGATSIRGSLSDVSIVKEALRNQDAVFHVASKVAMWGSYKDFYDTNVTGTLNLLAASQEQGIKTFIYTSTPSVVFGEGSIKGGDERLPYPKKTYSRYAKTKALAEKEVLKANGPQFRTVSLRPHLVFGPGDQNLIPRLLNSAKKNKLKIVGEGNNKVDVLYVENAADAHLCALDSLLMKESRCAGEAYFIGQGPISLWPFINSILKSHGIAEVQRKVSFKKAFLAGAMIEFILNLLRIYKVHPPMTRFVALQLAKHHYFKHEKALKDLGWEPKISIEEALGNFTINQ